MGRLCALIPALALVAGTVAQVRASGDATVQHMRSPESRERTLLKIYHDEADHCVVLGEELLWAVEQKKVGYERDLRGLLIRMGPRASKTWPVVSELHVDDITNSGGRISVDSVLRIGCFAGLGRAAFLVVLDAPIRNWIGKGPRTREQKTRHNYIRHWSRLIRRDIDFVTRDTSPADLRKVLLRPVGTLDKVDLLRVTCALQLLHATGSKDEQLREAVITCIERRMVVGAQLLLESKPHDFGNAWSRVGKSPDSLVGRTGEFRAGEVFCRVAGETLIQLWPEAPEAAIGYAIRARYAENLQLRLAALTRITPDANPSCEAWLADLLFDEDPRIRLEAVLTLSRVGRPGTKAAKLLERLAKDAESAIGRCAKSVHLAIESRAKR